MTHLSQRHIKKLIAKLGGKVIDITYGKHCHVHFSYYGHDCWSLFSISPSDRQWEQLKYSDIKRDLKRRGIWRDR